MTNRRKKRKKCHKKNALVKHTSCTLSLSGYSFAPAQLCPPTASKMSQDYRQIDPRIFISPPPHVFKCSVCLHLMFQPTTFCPGGHTLCNSCWNGVFANDQKIGKAPTCPICRAPTTDLGTLNQPIASQIDELTVRCEHANLAQPEPALLEAGSMPKRPKITQSGCCVWQGPISNAASHRLIDCPQQRTKCPLQFSCVGAPEGAWSCPTVVLRKDMEAHTLNCKWRPVTCNGCALRVPLERHDFHVEQHCVAAPLVRFPSPRDDLVTFPSATFPSARSFAPAQLCPRRSFAPGAALPQRSFAPVQLCPGAALLRRSFAPV